MKLVNDIGLQIFFKEGNFSNEQRSLIVELVEYHNKLMAELIEEHESQIIETRSFAAQAWRNRTVNDDEPKARLIYIETDSAGQVTGGNVHKL